MSHDVIVALLVGDIALSLSTIWMMQSSLKQERNRTDKYAAAVLNTSGEHKAATTISPEKVLVEPPDGRVRPQRIGLTPR